MRFLPLLIAFAAPPASAEQAENVPRIESSDCAYKADSAHKTSCSYLVVPENRHIAERRTIKLPFIDVQSNNPARKPDPVLYTGGGPGVSSLHPVTSITRRSLLRDRDYIAFEQRGTHFALPNLECEGEGQASGLDGKLFTISYQMRDGKAVTLDYGRSELLSIIHGKMEDYDGIKELPQIINDMIDGQQEPYVKEYFNGVFSANGPVSGMRLSVHCSDKMAFEDPATLKQQEVVMPWLAGFHVNDVYGAVCDSWPVTPIDANTKKTVLQQRSRDVGRGGLE